MTGPSLELQLARIVLEHAKPELQQRLFELTMAARRLTPSEKEAVLRALNGVGDAIFETLGAANAGALLGFLASVGEVLATIHRTDDPVPEGD